MGVGEAGIYNTELLNYSANAKACKETCISCEFVCVGFVSVVIEQTRNYMIITVKVTLEALIPAACVPAVSTGFPACLRGIVKDNICGQLIVLACGFALNCLVSEKGKLSARLNNKGVGFTTRAGCIGKGDFSVPNLTCLGSSIVLPLACAVSEYGIAVGGYRPILIKVKAFKVGLCGSALSK